MSITAQFLKFSLLGAEWVMYLLILCSIVSLSLIVDRIIYLMKSKGDFGSFVKELTERLNTGEATSQIAAWCSGQNLFEANVASVGLERTKSVRAAEDAMNATMIAAKTKMERGLVVLATLGNNTPFIGLFGTIIGIIQAFNALATSKAMGPEVVMASISEALVATAVGIMVAIPAVVGFNLLSRVIRRRMANGETISRIITTHIASQTQK